MTPPPAEDRVLFASVVLFAEMVLFLLASTKCVPLEGPIRRVEGGLLCDTY
jgi:hypothetical protein